MSPKRAEDRDINEKSKQLPSNASKRFSKYLKICGHVKAASSPSWVSSIWFHSTTLLIAFITNCRRTVFRRVREHLLIKLNFTYILSAIVTLNITCRLYKNSSFLKWFFNGFRRAFSVTLGLLLSLRISFYRGIIWSDLNQGVFRQWHNTLQSVTENLVSSTATSLDKSAHLLESTQSVIRRFWEHM